MNNLALITWSNTEYSDIWPPYFGRLERHFPNFKKSYIFLNEKSDRVPERHMQLINNEKQLFYKRFLKGLNEIEEDYVLYLQEDHIFYDDVDQEKIEQLLVVLKESDYSFIRLIKSGELHGTEIEENLFEIPFHSQYIFSQQSAIWKKEDLIKIFNFFRPKTYRDVENYGTIAMRNLRKTGCYYYDGGEQRGSLHYDSGVFPYIATAVCKGKWNINQYPEELGKALKEYDIDIGIRGTYD